MTGVSELHRREIEHGTRALARFERERPNGKKRVAEYDTSLERLRQRIQELTRAAAENFLLKQRQNKAEGRIEVGSIRQHLIATSICQIWFVM